MIEPVDQANGVMGVNRRLDYNADERLYGSRVREKLMKILRGESNRLDLMTKYYREPGRLSVIPVPADVDKRNLRLDKVEEILSSAVEFICGGSGPGPVAQAEESDGYITEIRDYPTRFPHMVIERTDSFDANSGELILSKWSIYRLQNQRRNVQINRALDAVNLGVELIRLIP